MTNRCFAYTRVSTVKQGERGVSLQEQKAAIERYAARNDLKITEWFEERVSAAKRGRPVFSRMLRQLKRDKVRGLVIHKIDRAARNLRDWAALGELINLGVKVHFANEAIDLSSRGGRLSADIQAVVAADYVRNLREETKKGFYGRLKQGFYPLPAPLGYVDCGGGKAKEVDPVRGPLVRKAFDLYATGEHSLDSLAETLFDLGLRNRNGRAVSRNGLSGVLNNPFYTGLIRVAATNETFEGRHEPLVTQELFDAVRQRLRGKAKKGTRKHLFLFRRLFRCGLCNRTLVGERQKGHVYYRCHSPSCDTKCVREEHLEKRIRQALSAFQISPKKRAAVLKEVEASISNSKRHANDRGGSASIRLAKLDERLARTTDAFLDDLIDKETFEERRRILLEERLRVKQILDGTSSDSMEGRLTRIRRALELAVDPLLSYEKASVLEKRELVDRVSSNRSADPDGVAVELQEPFSIIAGAMTVPNGDPRRDSYRTFARVATKLHDWSDPDRHKRERELKELLQRIVV